ncbi:MAG TPA: homoserine dehydrogenase [Bacteroidetes bacterium]|nr:homoserine dehydrogenase [Bacteroidota bacterium]
MTTTAALRIGLFGFGTVGQGLYDVLRRTPSLRTEIARICVRDRYKQRAAPARMFTIDRDEILDDPDVDVVVELIDDPEAAFDIVSRALESGKAVVSANKRMIASRLPQLLALQHRTGMPFLYEASTCGSIPIIRNLEEYYDNDLLQCVKAIVNGTTNYILTALHSPQSGGYHEALANAQRLGFAESDPTLDVEGYDAAFKTTIIAAHAFGVVLNPSQVVRRGITAVTPFDVSVAQQLSCSIKLLSTVQLQGDSLSVLSLPAFTPNGQHLATIQHEMNAVQLTAAFSDAQLLVGKGAGGSPTASAVLSDIAAIRHSYRYEYKRMQQPVLPRVDHGIVVGVYARATETILREVPFRSIEIDHRSSAGNYVIGHVRLDELQRCTAFLDPTAFIAIMQQK